MAGVAAGLARYLGVDVMIIRLAFVVLTIFGGAGIPLYLAGLLMIPEEGSDQSIASSLIESLAVPVAVAATGAGQDRPVCQAVAGAPGVPAGSGGHRPREPEAGPALRLVLAPPRPGHASSGRVVRRVPLQGYAFSSHRTRPCAPGEHRNRRAGR